MEELIEALNKELCKDCIFDFALGHTWAGNTMIIVPKSYLNLKYVVLDPSDEFVQEVIEFAKYYKINLIYEPTQIVFCQT